MHDVHRARPMDGLTPGCNRQRNDVVFIPMPCSVQLLPFVLAALVLPGRLGGHILRVQPSHCRLSLKQYAR